MNNNRVSGTLHVAVVTPRVRRVRMVKWTEFERALKHIFRTEPYRLKAIPKVFWVQQLGLYNKNRFSKDLSDDTLKAMDYLQHFPMGH